MRIMTVFFVLSLIFTAGVVIAEEPGGYRTGIVDQVPAFDPEIPEMTALKVSSMYLEIMAVLEKSALIEEPLLMELATASDESQCQAIIHRIEKLDRERDLGILRIQARYAHQAARWELEAKILDRIKDLEEKPQVAVK